MKNTLLLWVLLLSPIPLLFAEPDAFDYTPNNASGGIIATVEINGIPASSNDFIAAFDQDGNCVGATQLLVYYGQAFCNLKYYANDITTDEIDEGVDYGDTITFRLWVAATDEILDHPTNIPPVTNANSGFALSGSPLPGWGFADDKVLNFSSSTCTQTINLKPSRNLISLNVSPADKSLSNVFGNSLLNNINYISSYNKDRKIFIPNQPSFLNSLSEIEDGFGYWVNVENADVLIVEGLCLTDDFRKPLDAGWNLIAYPPDEPQAPDSFFADLIADGNLEFVAGFDDEIKIFNPNQPAFLNTLQQLENGRGYWVKVANTVD